jgi:hypothetical protein
LAAELAPRVAHKTQKSIHLDVHPPAVAVEFEWLGQISTLNPDEKPLWGDEPVVGQQVTVVSFKAAELLRA